MGTRIAPAQPPYAATIQECFDRLLPKGTAPLVLFTTLARDQRLLERFMRGAPLDVLHLSLRQREIIIDRVTALCGSEYEWGVHIAFFSRRAGLSDEQIASTAIAGSTDPVWSEQERLLLSVCEQLHTNCDIDEASWQDLRESFSDEAILEILMLAGYYRMISYITNALKLPLESYARRFPASASPKR
jgi:alkylhydroperoxidase family enzyme